MYSVCSSEHRGGVHDTLYWLNGVKGGTGTGTGAGAGAGTRVGGGTGAGTGTGR